MAAQHTVDCWQTNEARQVVRFDGTCLDLADTAASDTFSGRPG
jgi:hypothetical protein